MYTNFIMSILQHTKRNGIIKIFRIYWVDGEREYLAHIPAFSDFISC